MTDNIWQWWGPQTAKLTRIIVRIKHVGVTSGKLLKFFGVFTFLVGKSLGKEQL